MNDFFVRIKVVKKDKDDYYTEILDQRIITAETKNDVKKILLEDYPMLFSNGKVPQRKTKDPEQIVFCNIFPLDDYYRKYWNEKSICPICKSETTRIIKSAMGNALYYNCCTEECCDKYRDILMQDKIKNNEEYHTTNVYYIYKITNKMDNKCYVGITRNAPVWRWHRHQTANSEIGNALRDGNPSDFTYEILESFEIEDRNNINEYFQRARDIESGYIREFDSIKNGYNVLISSKDDKERVDDNE